MAIAVAMVVLKALQDRPADPQEVKEAMAAEMDTLRTEADKRHPNLAKSEAFAGGGCRARLRPARAANRRQARADGGLAVLRVLLRQYACAAEYCRSHGVDLAPFAKAFDAVHAAERDRARALLLRNGTDPETLYPLMRDQLGVTVAQDMQDTAKGIQGSAADACRVLNEHAAQFAATLVLPPEVRQALMQ
ncbi:hypothetical protein ACFOED_14910 [Vulcaniibacterium thermophilum]|uniref:hypothetical protein n=1 Tax=Vulcaniibacterium thermophilum TaxID=1169913 RepID=UPI003605C9AD